MYAIFNDDIIIENSILNGGYILKIAVFTDSFKPYISGVVRSIETFHKELTSLGHEIYIFAPRYPGCKPEEHVFQFIGIPTPRNPNFVIPIPFSLKLNSKILELDIDIIHVHSPFLLGRLGAKAAHHLGIPLVFTFHTFYEQYVHYIPFPQAASRKIAQTISRNFSNRCDLILAPSLSAKEYLQKIGVRSSIKILPTGIDLSKFYNEDKNLLRQLFSINKNEHILLFVGRIGKEKNIPFLLEAIRFVKQFESKIKLVLIGDGPEKERIKSLAVSYKLSDNILFTGSLDHKDVVTCYLEADIFVFPSVTETQGLVIGEAKAAGLPVVAIKEALGAAEMVEDGEDGILTPGLPEEFGKAILNLIQDKELYQKMKKRTQENVHKISSRSSALQLIASYEGLTSNKYAKKGS